VDRGTIGAGEKRSALDRSKKSTTEKLTFSVVANDGTDETCRGSHDRFVIDREGFDAKVALKGAARTSRGNSTPYFCDFPSPGVGVH
jgi:hypothetical protein